MASRVLENRATGERFIFTDDGADSFGHARVFTYEMQPGARVGAHRHPGHLQTFRVISGRLHVRVDGRQLVLNPGDTAACSRGGAHQQWNEGPEKVVVEESYDPPLNIEPFFAVLARAAERDEVLPIGALKNPFKFGVLFSDFNHVTAPASRSINLAIRLLGAAGSIFGYARWYEADLPHP
jgi:mannose-6-phosphate isomerase-like protein (cupin superfamily)